MSGDKTNWMQVMSDCASAFVREQGVSSCPVVDYELRSAIAGGPDDMRVWFICRTKEEKAEFISTEKSRGISLFKKKMIRAGFPESAVALVEINITSREEVQQAGGGSFFW